MLNLPLRLLPPAALLLLCFACAPTPPAPPPAPPIPASLPPAAVFEAPVRVDTLLGPPLFAEPFESALSAPGLPDTPVRSSTGLLPADWRVRPLWQQAAYHATYSRVENDNPEGTAAFRLDLRGMSQAYHDLLLPVPLPAHRFTRLAVQLRSTTTSQIALVLFAANPDGSHGPELWKQRRIGVAAEWQEQVFVIPPQNKAQTMFLALRMEQDGILDLDDLRVWSLEGAALNLGLSAPTGNAFDHSSFPAGLPGGWSVRSATASPDPASPGPSGLPSLHLVPAGRGQLISAPLRLPGETPCHLSFDAKGAREGQVINIRFGPPERQVSQNVTLGADWKHHSLRLTPGYPLSGIMVLRVFSSEPLWIDRLMLSERDTDFAPAHAVELSLHSDQNYALFDDTDPSPAFRLALHGSRGPGTRVELSLEDPQGRLTRLPDLAVPAGDGLWQSELHPALPAYAPYGSFRLEARVLDEQNQPLSAWTERIFHRVRRARHPDTFAPDSPFGIHILPTRGQADMAKKLGFNWMRSHDGGNPLTKWYYLEREPGVFDFAAADRAVDTLRDAKLMILGLLDTAPTWHSHWHQATKSGSYYQDALWVPRDLDAWEDYARRSVEHFRGRIDHWEVWNEPYVGMFFNRDYNEQTRQKRQGIPDDYAPLLERAHRAAKAANPDSLVLMSTGTAYRPEQSWHERLLQLGAGQHADAMTYHLYTTRILGDPDDTIAELTRKYRGGHRLGDAPLWNTEGGPGATFNHPYRRLPPQGHADAAHANADHAVRYFVSALANRSDKFFLYTLHSWGDWTRQWSVMNQDGSLPPLASALSNLFWHLEDSRFTRWEPLPDAGGWIAVFQRADGKTVEVLLPNLPLKDLEGAVDLYGNPWHPDSPHTARPAIRTR